jgi:hypothetical protein
MQVRSALWRELSRVSVSPIGNTHDEPRHCRGDLERLAHQAERIYRQAAAWLIANQDQLFQLRHPQ